MQRKDILAEVQSIIRAELGDSAIVISDCMVVDEVPDWDSVAHVRIIVATEQRFGIMLEPEEYMEFANVGELIDSISRKLKAQTTPFAPVLSSKESR